MRWVNWKGDPQESLLMEGLFLVHLQDCYGMEQIPTNMKVDRIEIVIVEEEEFSLSALLLLGYCKCDYKNTK